MEEEDDNNNNNKTKKHHYNHLQMEEEDDENDDDDLKKRKIINEQKIMNESNWISNIDTFPYNNKDVIRSIYLMLNKIKNPYNLLRAMCLSKQIYIIASSSDEEESEFIWKKICNTQQNDHSK